MNHSTEIRPVRRFRANPIEVTFLSLISLIFANSVYSLIYEHPGFQAIALTPMAAHPTSEGRTIASATSSLLNLNFDCDKTLPEATEATRVRISGQICGYSPNTATDGTANPKVEVKNNTNRNSATVFPDTTLGKFSTDYISLETGENVIHVDIHLGSGKTISRDIVITKS